MRAGLEHADQAGYGFAVVLGDPGYYSRFGFVAGRDFGLTFDDSCRRSGALRPASAPNGADIADGDLRSPRLNAAVRAYGDGVEFQVKELVKDALGQAGGRVRYIPEFAETVG